ncbi:MAG: CopD family protein [Tardiphaga sp.]|uniref:CopD family protein n=1 Tax=Tardiphaga sp. TaxID=1926292 RepID=UPI0019A01361|nr:CopD family protein [Tardiphaga sp.]MBC7586241.1 CopD family protein [Tardiphaga sp.]
MGWIHLAADLGHLLAAGLWLGALTGLLLLLNRARTAPSDPQSAAGAAHCALANFGSAGTIAVAVIIITGEVDSWILVGPDHVIGLTETSFGRPLMLKLLLFGGVLLFAAHNRFQLYPALHQAIVAGSHDDATRRLGRSVALETGLALAILGIVAWLGTLAPPASAA